MSADRNGASYVVAHPVVANDRNTGNAAQGPHLVDLHLPIIGRTAEGTVGR